MSLNIKDVLINLSARVRSLLSLTQFISWGNMGSLFANYYPLTLSNITNGSNWSYTSLKANLIGHVVHVNLRSTRSSKTGSGNITNQTVVSFKINHGGMLKGIYSVSAGNMDGTIATFQISTVNNDDNTSTITITLAATHAAMKYAYIDDYLPAEINLSHSDWGVSSIE